MLAQHAWTENANFPTLVTAAAANIRADNARARWRGALNLPIIDTKTRDFSPFAARHRWWPALLPLLLSPPPQRVRYTFAASSGRGAWTFSTARHPRRLLQHTTRARRRRGTSTESLCWRARDVSGRQI